MSLIDVIKAERLSARKARDSITSSILTTLAGELESKAKRDGSEVTDELVISSAKKFIQSNTDTLKSVVCTNTINVLTKENEILAALLPKQLTELEIVDIIVGLKSDSIGEIMKHFKITYSGQYDGKLVNTMARASLS